MGITTHVILIGMRIALSLAVLVSISYLLPAQVSAQTTPILTTNLMAGSSGPQVVLLQQLLNRDSDTRIALSGLGSPGFETSYFGLLTKAAVIRFQNKYASEVLSPAGLSQGTGFVGLYTRNKLNSLVSANLPATVTTPTSSSGADYLVKDSERIDIYAGDKLIAALQSKVRSAFAATVESSGTTTVTLSTISPSDFPSVVIKDISPRSGTVGTRISLSGTGISTISTVYLGTNYRVRVTQDLLGNMSFLVPSIPSGFYDLAVQTSGAVSATTPFVVTDPKNPAVQLQSVSPAKVGYGETLTITGSGFSPLHNVVVTPYRKFVDVPSSDGKTLTISLDFELPSSNLSGSQEIPLTVYVVNEYGFSDVEKSFIMTL